VRAQIAESLVSKFHGEFQLSGRAQTVHLYSLGDSAGAPAAETAPPRT